jgi:hypothetical protein
MVKKVKFSVKLACAGLRKDIVVLLEVPWHRKYQLKLFKSAARGTIV